VEKDASEKVEFMKYMLAKILPCLKQIDQEQHEELELESKIQGKETLTVQHTNIPMDERLFWYVACWFSKR
jgi:lysine-specific demethylase 3